MVAVDTIVVMAAVGEAVVVAPVDVIIVVGTFTGASTSTSYWC